MVSPLLSDESLAAVSVDEAAVEVSVEEVETETEDEVVGEESPEGFPMAMPDLISTLSCSPSGIGPEGFAGQLPAGLSGAFRPNGIVPVSPSLRGAELPR